MLIRDNKTSIKNLFWRDRIREGQMIERGRQDVEGGRKKEQEGERESTQVCVTEWIIPKTPLSAHHCETHTHTHIRIHTHGCSDCAF